MNCSYYSYIDKLHQMLLFLSTILKITLHTRNLIRYNYDKIYGPYMDLTDYICWVNKINNYKVLDSKYKAKKKVVSPSLFRFRATSIDYSYTIHFLALLITIDFIHCSISRNDHILNSFGTIRVGKKTKFVVTRRYTFS